MTVTIQCPGVGELDSSAVRKQVDRITSSKGFAQSERLRSFLRYTVEETLAGRGWGLKETAIAVSVFGREPDFDPRADAVVRVTANKLRSRLTEYYATVGQTDPIRISFHPGTYKPNIEGRQQLPTARRATRWFAFASGLASLAIVALRFRSSVPITAPVPLQLTNGYDFVTQPAISPDGRWFAYTSHRSGNFDIWAQPVHTSEAVQLSRQLGNDAGATFSPDGQTVLYYSDQDGPNMYTVSLDGRNERLIARGAQFGRFSPDGTIIACWAQSDSHFRLALVPANGGVMRLLETKPTLAGEPPGRLVWSESGTHIVVRATDRPGSPMDWWLVALDTGSARKLDVCTQTGRVGNRPGCPDPRDWRAGYVYFTAAGNETSNVFRIRVSSSMRVEGNAEQITSGPDRQMHPSISASGDLVYVSAQVRHDIYETGTETTGVARRITSVGTVSTFSLSANARVVLFSASRYGHSDVWKRDLISGRQRLIAGSPGNERAAGLNADGSRVFFTAEDELFAADDGNQLARSICKKCTFLETDAPGKSVWIARSTGAIDVLDTESGHFTRFIDAEPGEIHQLRRSRDGLRWVVSARTRSGFGVFTFDAPVSSPTDRTRWTAIDHLNRSESPPVVRWSADGKTVVYTAPLRDSFNCLWAKNAGKTSSTSEPYSIRHEHAPQPTGGIRSFDTAESRLVYLLAEGRSNVWLQKIK